MSASSLDAAAEFFRQRIQGCFERTGALLRHDRGTTEGYVAAKSSDIGSPFTYQVPTRLPDESRGYLGRLTSRILAGRARCVKRTLFLRKTAVSDMSGRIPYGCPLTAWSEGHLSPRTGAKDFIGKMTTTCANPRKLSHFLAQFHIRCFLATKE